MEIKKIEEGSNDCGGFRPPKGHLDTQLFPECKGTETDRDVVKNTTKKKKRKKKKKEASMQITAKHSWPVTRTRSHQSPGLWDQWLENSIQDEEFVRGMIYYVKMGGWAGISLDPIVRSQISKAIENYESKVSDVGQTAIGLSQALSAGKMVNEEMAREQLLQGQEPEQYDDVEILSSPSFALTNIDRKLIKAQMEKKKLIRKLLTTTDIKLMGKKKKKDWDPNPWAVCNTTVDKDEDPEKFERCVKKVKKEQMAFNLKKHISS